MSARAILLIITVLLAASAMATDVRLEHAHELRYKTLDDVPDIHQYIRVRSKRPGVSPGDIVLTIKATTGDIVLHPDAAGLVEMPTSAELVKENPRIVTNQPDGSIGVSSAVSVWREGKTRLGQPDYKALLKARSRYLQVAGFIARASAPDPHGLVLAYPEGAPPSVIVRRHGVAEDVRVVGGEARVDVTEGDEDADLSIDSVVAPESVRLWAD